MSVRPIRIVPRRTTPGLSTPAEMFCYATPLSQSGGSALSSEASDLHAPGRLLLPPRLILPPSATVKRSLWVFRTTKLELLKD
jgi:hypothetical protein